MHEVVSTSKLAVTKLAGEWLLALVDQVVSLQLVRVGEAGVADVALVRPLTGVNPQMSTQIGHLDKLPLTMSARVRLFTRVQPHVRLEMVVAGEPLVTHLALERFLTGVGPLVVLQYVFVTERPVADFAGEDLLPAVLVVARVPRRPLLAGRDGSCRSRSRCCGRCGHWTNGTRIFDSDNTLAAAAVNAIITRKTFDRVRVLGGH